MIRAARTLLFVLSLAGCNRAVDREMKLKWSYSPPGYISNTDIREGYFGKDGVLLHNRSGFGGLLVKLDAESGKVMWQRHASWVMHPPGSLQPLYVIDHPANQPNTEVIELDPNTGEELRRVSLARPVSSVQSRFTYADGLFLGMSYGGLWAFDAQTGAESWYRTIADRNAYLHKPIVASNRVIYQGTDYLAIDTKTGATLFAYKGTCCTALMSPNGTKLYVGHDSHRWARLDLSGQQIHLLDGNVEAVSDAYVAVQEASRLAVYEHSGAKPVWSITTTDKHYVTAVALTDSRLYYFSAKDKAVMMHDLRTKKTREVVKIGSRFVIGTERGQTGLAGPYLSVPPQWRAPYLYIYNWNLRAYREK